MILTHNKIYKHKYRDFYGNKSSGNLNMMCLFDVLAEMSGVRKHKQDNNCSQCHVAPFCKIIEIIPEDIEKKVINECRGNSVLENAIHGERSVVDSFNDAWKSNIGLRGFLPRTRKGNEEYNLRVRDLGEVIHPMLAFPFVSGGYGYNDNFVTGFLWGAALGSAMEMFMSYLFPGKGINGPLIGGIGMMMGVLAQFRRKVPYLDEKQAKVYEEFGILRDLDPTIVPVGYVQANYVDCRLKELGFSK